METQHKNTAFSHFRNALLLTGLLGLAACGGGGGGGDDGSSSGSVTFNTSQASVSSEGEAKAVSEASRQASLQAIFTDDALNAALAGGVEIQPDSIEQHILDFSTELAISLLSPTAAAADPIPGDCGGEIIITDNQDGSVDFDYNKYCSTVDEEKLTIDGTIHYEFNLVNGQVTSYTAEFDLTYTYAGETQSNQGSISCSGENASQCTYSTDFDGSNGERYRIENVTVSGDISNGFTVHARVYHREHGYVDFQATGLILCTNGAGFMNGTITVTDASGVVATATFSGCGADYTVTYNGVGYPVPQQ